MRDASLLLDRLTAAARMAPQPNQTILSGAPPGFETRILASLHSAEQDAPWKAWESISLRFVPVSVAVFLLCLALHFLALRENIESQITDAVFETTLAQ